MSKEAQQGMTVIVKTVTRLTSWLILLYGIHIVLHGHVSPGGGFAGGVIIALSLIHLTLAYGKDIVLERLSQSLVQWGSMGALLFLVIGVAGLFAGYFFRNFLPHGEPFSLFSAGTIPASNIAISFNVWAGLFTVFVALVLLRFDDGED